MTLITEEIAGLLGIVSWDLCMKTKYIREIYFDHLNDQIYV